jgi:protein-S-isoprenylcysteine O-methyltransferase Ste14
MSKSRPLIGGVIVLYFIIGLEVLVMISPFAGFFYAAFNPVLLFLARWPQTHWLADFFLPHMVLPPGAFLKALRVAGSVLFIGGALVFLVCAGQVYLHKLLRRGPVLGGLYAWIRHPQYSALAVTGLGLAILWPRFLTLVLWTVMVGLYTLLARDEERRMVSAFGDAYRAHMSRTGMFVPRGVEQALARLPGPSSPALRVTLALALAFAVTIGGAFALRAYTVAHLPLWSNGRVSVLAVLPADSVMLQHRMEDVLRMPEVESRLAKCTGAILAYVVPVQYVMQGMIADTDPAFRLYEHHQTVPMIVDWIVHPFRHLEGGHDMMHHTTGPPPANASPRTRRVIFLRVESSRGSGAGDPSSLFAVGAVRVPQFFIDVDMHGLTLLEVKELGPGTGWGDVPTPMF